MAVHSFFDKFFVIELGKALMEMKALKQNEILKIIFLIYSLHFMIYFKMDKTGVIYMSIAFHSHITCENWPKNDRATLKSKKTGKKSIYGLWSHTT